MKEQKEQKIIRFMRWRNLTTGLSLVLVLGSFISLGVMGLNFGLDFTGGSQIEVFYSEPVELQEVQDVVGGLGYENFEAVYFGTEQEVLIRIQDTAGEEVDPELAAQTGDRVVRALQERSDATVELQSSEYVGSVVGDELKEQGILGLLVSMGMMMIFIAIRFQWKFGLAMVGALAEDVVITLGFFSVTQLNFDLTVLASVMAVIGYGLNDTIVICDRIRENFRILRKADTEEIIDISITQTIARTLVIAGIVLAVLIVLLLLGGDALRGFSIALIAGVVVGTYSTVYVATSTLLKLHLTREDMTPSVKRNEELDAIP